MATLRAYGTPGERAQQTQFWAQYYPGQQRANAQFDLSAWAAAQDAQYRQDQADAAAEQQNFANRVNLSRFSIGLDDSAQRLAEDRRRFDVNTGLAYGRPAIERAAEIAQAQGDEVNAIEFAKQRVAETGNAFDQSTKRLETAKGAYDARFNEIAKGLTPATAKFDRATGLFAPLYPSTDTTLLASIAKANDTLTRHVSEYNLAQQEHKSVADLFQQAQQQLPRGVQVGKRDGKWVINSPGLRREFSWSPPPLPPPTATGSNLGNPVMGDVRMAERAIDRPIDLSRFSASTPQLPNPPPIQDMSEVDSWQLKIAKRRLDDATVENDAYLTGSTGPFDFGNKGKKAVAEYENASADYDALRMSISEKRRAAYNETVDAFYKKPSNRIPVAPRVDLSQFSTAPNAPATTPRRYPPAFYDRVNQLVASGVDPRAAKARAMQEFSR